MHITQHTHGFLGLAVAGLVVGGVESTAFGQGCEAEPAWVLPSAATYFTAEDCPWADLHGWDYFYLEDFEDGEVSTPGLIMSGDPGYVRGPGYFTDSVDGDDGVIDGSGADGHSYHAMLVPPAENVWLEIEFTLEMLEVLPSHAGFVWTDAYPDAVITVTVFNADDEVVTVTPFTVGNDEYYGSTAEDRFVGLRYQDGIARVRLETDKGGLEIDHVQYGHLPPCFGDTNDDRLIDTLDLLGVLAAWGDCVCCPQDVDEDGNVGFTDLLEVLSAWGTCAEPTG